MESIMDVLALYEVVEVELIYKSKVQNVLLILIKQAQHVLNILPAKAIEDSIFTK